jgi:hypothetical protein
VRGRAPLFLADAEVDAKFIGCAEPAIGEGKAHTLLQELRCLERQPRIQTLMPGAYGLASDTG